MVCYYESIILNFGWLDIWLGIKYLHSIKRYNLEIVQLFARLEYVFDIRSSRNALNEYNKEEILFYLHILHCYPLHNSSNNSFIQFIMTIEFRKIQSFFLMTCE